MRLARQNAVLNGLPELRVLQSDGLAAVEETDFTQILCNPPYHTDFAVPKRLIEGSFDHLAMGGRLWMVTKRRDWYKNKLIAVFGGVTITEVDGYHVFMAQKRSTRFARR